MKEGQVRGKSVIGLCLAWLFAAGCSLSWAPSAVAALPANDDFANREMLSGSLPIEVSRSNLSATKESGEFLGMPFSAGHSVWFEWEATSSGWVTVGGCDADFVNVVGIYTGTAVGALTRIASGNDSEGPHCPFGQREYTFKAMSGTKYEIAVDGNPFRLFDAPPPLTEGSFKLRIEATPPPANDDFANATPIVTTLEEEFEGQAFYFDSKFGNNWNATTESGEPDHVGGPNGASVWYSWTAPVSGEAKISAGCCSSGLRLGIYTGNSIGDLQLLSGGMGPGGSVTRMVSAGTTYRVAVYGLIDQPGSEAAMSNFQVMISMRVPVPSGSGGKGPAPPSAADTTPPDTTIYKSVLKRSPPIWIFRFLSSEPRSTFRCRLDEHRAVVCPSSKRFGNLGRGRHTLKVVAVDAAGNKDPTPAVVHFGVLGKPKHPHKAT